jgi:RNA polymerase sigma-70 factor (ECF subfamily)
MEAPSTEATDLELVRRAQGGDGTALELLLGRHYGTAYRVAYRWCGTRQDAEDIAQEAFIKVARGIRSFRGSASFTTWLYRIVVNAANDLHRQNAARARLADEAGGRAATAAPTDASPGGDAERALEAVAALPEKQRTALRLVCGEGLSHREAAAVMDCPEVTISWRIFQARRKLGKIMEAGR